DCRKSEVWKMMILDNFTMKLLSLCCRMSDLISGGITIVKDLFKIRKPVPDLKAIYFMIPTEKRCTEQNILCVDVLIVDFKIKPKYKAAYVYFAEIFNKMKLSCAKPIRVCKEIGVSVLSQESHVKCLSPESPCPQKESLFCSCDKEVQVTNRKSKTCAEIL
uniref:Uncharacterized protein n=1 Tax=Scleropages formosus TaxID=113540 RepID=A0A8C9R4B3_SCLFO